MAYASDDHSCQDGACNTTVTTQGLSLLMTHKHLGLKKIAAISTGALSCPCLEELRLDTHKGGTFPEKIYEKIVNRKAVKTLPECDGSSKEWYFPPNLGIGSCTSMDKLPPFCGTGDRDSPKRWKTDWMCKQRFCHVDPDKCPPEWVISGNLFPGLPFSYMTCASKEEMPRAEKMTKILQEDHRAYHCAAEEVDPQLQNDADGVKD